ncbi:MAG TPA: hypothetical protein VD835_20170, partial [Pyrinomonadaceae bacterium]|nr:hypothetical protein [Pyrinomonadaceae bacterium]
MSLMQRREGAEQTGMPSPVARLSAPHASALNPSTLHPPTFSLRAFAPLRETFLPLLFASLLFAALCLPAQTFAQKTASIAAPAPTPDGAASVAALYAEAEGYARKKYEAFEREGIGYNEKLVEQVEREQRTLAARYAAEVAARDALAPGEVFHLGQLYNVADDPERAVGTMRRFLAENPRAASDEQHAALYVIALQTAKSGSPVEAEAALAEYLKVASPTAHERRYRLESALAASYRGRKQ